MSIAIAEEKKESSPREAGSPEPASKCRFCGSPLNHTFVDLGMSPLCESYVDRKDLNSMEPFYPLHVKVCEECFLVQVDEYVSAHDIYSEYAYFSSYSDSWLKHASDYVDMITGRLGLDSSHFVVELASNDGYLLRNFVARGIPVLGVEPAANVARKAVEEGVPSLVKFFGAETARGIVEDRGRANLIVGNNVLAHVPDIRDFVEGISLLLDDEGVTTLEFPHLVRLMEGVQYDTIYHEHFSYLSLIAVEKIFAAYGLEVFDVEELSTHGGSIRVYGQHAGRGKRPVGEAVVRVRNHELELGLDGMAAYEEFSEQVKESKRSLLDMLIRLRREGKTVAGYGAPGKGNTLLNYCGIRTDFLDFTVDRNPYKHGKVLPGTHIPIYPVEAIAERRPDYILILPWNLRDEIVKQLEYTSEWGAKFIIPIPDAEIVEG